MIKQALYMKDQRDIIIEKMIDWQRLNFPARTPHFDKCRRDMRYVIKAYCSDVYQNDTISTKNVGEKYWFNGQRQIKEYQAEVAVHCHLRDYLINELIPGDIQFAEKITELHKIFENIIVNGPEYQSSNYMHYYRYVYEYEQDSQIDKKLIKNALYDAWKNTPSKNNFMPYKVHVVDSYNQATKELIYYKCLENETKANGNHITDLEGLKNYERTAYKDVKPNYYNIKNADHILIFTQRVEDQLNDHQAKLVENGFVYEQMYSNGPKKDSARSVAYLEIGMFCSNFANACLAQGIDISHTLCFPNDKKDWPEPEFEFLDMNPLLIMTLGKAKKFRRDLIPDYLDHKPNFERIINYIDK